MGFCCSKDAVGADVPSGPAPQAKQSSRVDVDMKYDRRRSVNSTRASSMEGSSQVPVTVLEGEKSVKKGKGVDDAEKTEKEEVRSVTEQSTTVNEEIKPVKEEVKEVKEEVKEVKEEVKEVKDEVKEAVKDAEVKVPESLDEAPSATEDTPAPLEGDEAPATAGVILDIESMDVGDSVMDSEEVESLFIGGSKTARPAPKGEDKTDKEVFSSKTHRPSTKALEEEPLKEGDSSPFDVTNRFKTARSTNAGGVEKFSLDTSRTDRDDAYSYTESMWSNVEDDLYFESVGVDLQQGALTRTESQGSEKPLVPSLNIRLVSALAQAEDPSLKQEACNFDIDDLSPSTMGGMDTVRTLGGFETSRGMKTHRGGMKTSRTTSGQDTSRTMGMMTSRTEGRQTVFTEAPLREEKEEEVVDSAPEEEVVPKAERVPTYGAATVRESKNAPLKSARFARTSRTHVYSLSEEKDMEDDEEEQQEVPVAPEAVAQTEKVVEQKEEVVEQKEETVAPLELPLETEKAMGPLTHRSLRRASSNRMTPKSVAVQPPTILGEDSFQTGSKTERAPTKTVNSAGAKTERAPRSNDAKVEEDTIDGGVSYVTDLASQMSELGLQEGNEMSTDAEVPFSARGVPKEGLEATSTVEEQSVAPMVL